jgi:hypothetical protein
MNQKMIESLIDEILLPSGFKKKKATWYRKTTSVLQLLNLQKSQYGAQFFVNLGFVPDGIPVDGMPTPKENKCPIRIRLSSALAAERDEIEALFDLEQTAISDLDRDRRIRELFSSKVIPLFETLSDTLGLKAGIEQGVFKRGAINRLAQECLGIALS